MRVKFTYHDGRTIDFETAEYSPCDVYKAMTEAFSVLSINGKTTSELFVVRPEPKK